MKLTELPANCLPSRVMDENIYLVDVGHDRLAEPLYQVSLERLCEQEKAARVRIGLDTLVSLTESERLAGPQGLIFHTGRCGSTLLANMLGAHPAVRMVKESEALNQILLDHGSPAAVSAILRGFGRGLPAAAALLVKCTNWNMGEYRRLLDAFPAASAIFLWRPAAEVVASCLDVPPLWADWHEDPELCGTWYPQVPANPAELTRPVEFYAHAWRVTAAAALDAAGEYGSRMRIISYAQLRADPAAVAAASARHFGVPATPEHLARMTAQAAMYSKYPAGPFDPAGVHARPQLSASDRRVVDRIAGRLEARLRHD